MVRLTRIYTRGGDRGETSASDGGRVPKHDPCISAIGTVEEANAHIGCARLHTSGEADEMLSRIQNDMFDLGADIGGSGRYITPAQVKRLENEIDTMNGNLAPLDSFILPGGSSASAHIHLARTVVRRAERMATELAETRTVNPGLLEYINRLSDHLFVLARYLNEQGRDDVKWYPGANREKT